MSHLDDLPVEERYIPRSGPMFSRGSGVRAELATDEAIPILAEGGWGALTMRNVAKAANVTPHADPARDRHRDAAPDLARGDLRRHLAHHRRSRPVG